jgi:hypothetical protein
LRSKVVCILKGQTRQELFSTIQRGQTSEKAETKEEPEFPEDFCSGFKAKGVNKMFLTTKLKFAGLLLGALSVSGVTAQTPKPSLKDLSRDPERLLVAFAMDPDTEATMARGCYNN